MEGEKECDSERRKIRHMERGRKSGREPSSSMSKSAGIVWGRKEEGR